MDQQHQGFREDEMESLEIFLEKRFLRIQGPEDASRVPTRKSQTCVAVKIKPRFEILGVTSIYDPVSIHWLPKYSRVTFLSSSNAF